MANVESVTLNEDANAVIDVTDLFLTYNREMGSLQGTQKNFAFLPEQHTDFIFSVVGEELGDGYPIATLSGPSHAEEVVRDAILCNELCHFDRRRSPSRHCN